MVEEARRRIEVGIPEVAVAEIDRVKYVGSGDITVHQIDSTELRPLVYGVDELGYLRYIRTDTAGRLRGTWETTGIANVASGRVEIRPLPLPITGTIAAVGVTPAFYQDLNKSILSGETLVYTYDISGYDKKTIGIWSNTGNVRTTLLVSNDGTNYYQYYQTDISSGQYKTMSFTEVFKNLGIRVFALTDAGYNILIGFR